MKTIFANLSAPGIDPLMEIGRLYRSDTRPDKIDLGLGTYRDASGNVGIMQAVSEAERHLIETSVSKSYLGPGGDAEFCALLRDTLWPGLSVRHAGKISCIQAPGGTGALRLAFELIAEASPATKVIVGTPTWPAHIPLMLATSVRHSTYRHYDPATGDVDFDALTSALHIANFGELVLLHGCCHNPTGATLSLDQWQVIIDIMASRGLIALVDFAYAGMAEGLDQDTARVAMLLDALPNVLVALSCSKSFGLYRDRVGMLLTKSTKPEEATTIGAVSEAFARRLWSNPPAHGASVVRTILSNDRLTALWKSELQLMRTRLGNVRKRIPASM